MDVSCGKENQHQDSDAIGNVYEICLGDPRMEINASTDQAYEAQGSTVPH